MLALGPNARGCPACTARPEAGGARAGAGARSRGLGARPGGPLRLPAAGAGIAVGRLPRRARATVGSRAHSQPAQPAAQPASEAQPEVDFTTPADDRLAAGEQAAAQERRPRSARRSTASSG